MNIRNAYNFDAPPQAVWDLLVDIGVGARKQVFVAALAIVTAEGA